MVAPFIDYTTISQILDRLSVLETQVGLTNTTTTDVSAAGLFFIPSVAGQNPPGNPTDLSKIRFVAFQTPRKDIDASSTGELFYDASILPFNGALTTYFVVTPRVHSRPSGVGAAKDGNISARWVMNSDNVFKVFYTRTGAPSDATKINVSFNVFGIAVFP